jgi:hypothetical protein
MWAATIGRSRARAWLHRYLPAELIGTTAALVAAGLAAGAGAETAVLAAAWAEAVAFYGFVTLRELRRTRLGRRTSRAVARAVRDVVAEFGVAEAADTILVRPFLMFELVGPLGGLIPGVIAGKLAADVVFYGLAVPAYELRERGRR